VLSGYKCGDGVNVRDFNGGHGLNLCSCKLCIEMNGVLLIEHFY